MSRTIDSVAYALQGTTDNSATYGATLGAIPTTVRFQSLPTRQGGLEGVRTTRVVSQKVTLADGQVVTVSESHTSFVPNVAAKTNAAGSRAVLRALMSEEGYDAAVAAQAVE